MLLELELTIYLDLVNLYGNIGLISILIVGEQNNEFLNFRELEKPLAVKTALAGKKNLATTYLKDLN